MKESEKIEKKNGTNREEKGIGERKGNGKFGERRAEKFADERNVLVDEESPAKKEKETESEKNNERLGPGKLFLKRVIKAGEDKDERKKTEEVDDRNA